MINVKEKEKKMRYDRPSATLAKNDEAGNPLPNIIKITNRALDENAADGIKFEIKAERFEFPQAENDEDRIAICGGAENALKVFNKMLADDALAAAKTKIRVASSGSQEEIIESAILTAKNFTYVEEQAISAAEAKNRISELRNVAATGNLTDAELAAKVRALLGISA